MTNDPKSFKAPGLSWRPRTGGRWEARWKPHTKFVERGLSAEITSLWVGKPEDFTEVDMAYITGRCEILHSAMTVEATGGIALPEGYDGTLRSLIRRYETDPDSTYQGLRYATKQTYGSHLRVIVADHGGEMIKDLDARQMLHWHKAWSSRGATMAHGLMGMIRTVMTYGATMLDDKAGRKDCRALKVELHDMRFSRPASGDERLTAEMAVAIRDKAREMGLPSIALAQAIQFECALRQRDVIGEWVPETEPGISDVLEAGEKWLRGARWSEIDHDMILRHLTSKRQKVVEIDLKLAPMVLEELAYLGARPESGPIVVNDRTALPWQAYDFRRWWRKVADAAGIPKHIKSMHSRHGALSEATNSGAVLEDVRHLATHSNIAMTQKYSRGAQEKIARVMQSRVAHRNKSRT